MKRTPHAKNRYKRFGRLILFFFSFALFFLSGCKYFRQPTDAPFPLDSLMAYNHDGLVKLAGSSLKDSTATDNTGKLHHFTTMMAKTKLEVEIEWEDSTRRFIKYATIRGNSAGASWWETRDSVTVGMTMNEIEKINRAPFQLMRNQLGKDDDRSYLFMLGKDGKLRNRIYTIRFDAHIIPGKDSVEEILSSSAPQVKANNPIVIEVTLDRGALPSKLAVETIVFTDKVGGGKSNVPHVVDRTGWANPAADNINAAILKRLLIDSFDPAKEPDFSWSDLTFDWKKDDKILFLNIKGTYLGSYPTDIDENMFFQLAGGDNLPEPTIPFQWLLAYEKYFPFFDKYWVKECAAKMDNAKACADMELGCGCNNINISGTDKNITLTLNNEDCFPHVAQACSPQHTLTLPLETISPYLNPVAKKLLESGFYQKKPLEKFAMATNASDQLPDNFFMRWAFEDMHPGSGMPNLAYSMALQFTQGPGFFGEGTIIGYIDRDALPADYDLSNVEKDPGPEKITGTFNANGFILKGSVFGDAGIKFTWHDESWEDKGVTEIKVGKRYLSPDEDVRLELYSMTYNKDRFFYSEPGE